MPLAVEARRGTHQVHLDVDIGDVVLLDGHPQGVGRLIHVEAFADDQTIAAQREQALGGDERRLHQNLRRVAGLVLPLVGDQHRLLLLHLVDRGPLPTAHPASDLGQVGATLLVLDGSGDTVGTALRRLKGAAHRLVGRERSAYLLVRFLLLPGAFDEHPTQAHRSHLDSAARYRLAVQVGDDSVHDDGLASLDKGAPAAQAHV